MSPAENTTVLITDLVPPSHYSKLAKRIMAYTHLAAEQVGYMSSPLHADSLIRLEMSGGEFCGNALLATGALARYMDITDEEKFSVEISGANFPLPCYVQKRTETKYRVRSLMPLDYQHEQYQNSFPNGVDIKGELIRFNGITHLVFPKNEEHTKQILSGIVKHLSKEVNSNAVGLIPYTKGTGYKIEPCVYVPQTGSLIFERGCGSGTFALGLHLFHRERASLELNVEQNGGVIKVIINSSNGENQVKESFLETDLEITCEGKVFV